jgi:hypothetical protein
VQCFEPCAETKSFCTQMSCAARTDRGVGQRVKLGLRDGNEVFQRLNLPAGVNMTLVRFRVGSPRADRVVS